MKNLVKLVGIIAFVSIIVLPMAAQTVEGGWSKYIDDSSTATLDYSITDDGVITVTVGGRAMPQSESWNPNVGYWYTAQALKANTSYTYIFEAWTQSGTRDMTLNYYDNNDPFIRLQTNISITNERKTYTITGVPLPPNGDKKFTFFCGDQLGTFYVKILEIREARRGEEPAPLLAQSLWSKNVQSRTTLDYSVANDGVVTATVGGSVSNTPWDTQLHYHYTAKANTNYTYIFEAWTQRGNRDLGIGYYWDNELQQGLPSVPITITNRRRTYTVTGQAIPKDGSYTIWIDCANQLGTFYIKILEVREATPAEALQASLGNWYKWIADNSTTTLDLSVARDGVVTVNVGGRAATQYEDWKAQARYLYTAKANTRYTYVFEAWTQRGTRELRTSYYWDNESYLADPITITNRRTTYTITGQTIPKDGVSNLEFWSANQTGRFFIKILEIREATPADITRAQWGKRIHDSTTLDYSVADDGVVTAIVGGRAVPQAERWKAEMTYRNNTKANTRYTYVFEAWTQSGNRDIGFTYYVDHTDQIYLNETITITDRRQTYTITGQTILKDKDIEEFLFFQCADQLGTFYLKLLEIREN